MPNNITRQTKTAKSRKASKPEPKWREKTIDAGTLARMIADVLDYEEGMRSDDLHTLAECIASTFDFTEEEHDAFVRSATVKKSDAKD